MMMSSRVGVLIDRRVRALQRALLLEGTRPFFLDEDTKKRFRVFCYPKYFYARRLPLLLYCFFFNYAHANARRFRRRIQPPEYCIVVIVAPSSFTSSSSSRRPFLQPKKKLSFLEKERKTRLRDLVFVTTTLLSSSSFSSSSRCLLSSVRTECLQCHPLFRSILSFAFP